MKRSILILCLLSHCLLLCAQEALETLKAGLQDRLEQFVAKNELPGATAAVVLPEGQLISLAAGFADLEAGTRMEPGALMFSGSVGKTFVAALVMQQVGQGAIGLEDKLIDHFGEHPWYQALPNAGEITVRMLLQHRSGLPRYVFLDSFKKALLQDRNRSWEPAELLNFVANKPAMHPAGKGWSYSDTNYLLLGLLLEKVSGRPYYALLEDKILKPLGLEKTFPSDKRELPGLTPGYIGSENILGFPNKKTVTDGHYAINPQFEWTGGGLITNSEDLARWMHQLHHNKLLSHRILKEMVLPVAFQTGQPARSGYGLGSFVWEVNGALHYGHEGIMPGHVTSVEFAKDAKIAIAIQVNTDEGFTRKLHGLSVELKRICLEGLLAMEEEAILDNFQRQEACWNQGSIDCYMEAYHPDDSICTISSQGVAFGYETIRQQYNRNWPQERMGQLHFDNFFMERLPPVLYTVIGRFNLAMEGRDEPYRGWFSVLMKKIDGKWLMVSDHSS